MSSPRISPGINLITRSVQPPKPVSWVEQHAHRIRLWLLVRNAMLSHVLVYAGFFSLRQIEFPDQRDDLLALEPSALRMLLMKQCRRNPNCVRDS
jgi:hypothetical protein